MDDPPRRKFLKGSLAVAALGAGAMLGLGKLLGPRTSQASSLVVDQNEMQANDYIVNSAAQNWRTIGGVHSTTSLDFQAYQGGSYSDVFFADISGTLLGTSHNLLDYTDTNSVVGSAQFAGNLVALGNKSSIIGDVNISNSGTYLSSHAVRHENGGADAITNLGAFEAKGLVTLDAGITGTGTTGTIGAGSGILGTPNTWGAVQDFQNYLKFGGAQVSISTLLNTDLLQYNGTNWVNVDPTTLGLVNALNSLTGDVTLVAGTNVSISSAGGNITISTTSTSSSSSTFTALGTATSTNQTYGSNTITYQGSYWDGSSAQTDSMVIGLTQLTTTPTYGFFVQVGGGSNVFQVDQAGNVSAFSALTGTYNIGGTPTLISTLALNGQTLSGSSIFSGLPTMNQGVSLAAIADASHSGKLFLSSTTANVLKYYDAQSTPVLHQLATLDSASIPNSALAGNLVSSITGGTNISVTNPSGVGAATVNVVGNPSFATSVTSPFYLFSSALADASAAGKLFLSSTTANYLKYYDTQAKPVLHQIAVLDSGSIPNSALAGNLLSSLTTETAAGITLTATNPSGVGAGYYVPSVTLGGDLSGSSLGAATVAKLQTYTLTITSPSTNQILVWNGSAWVNQGVPATAGVTSVNSLTGAVSLTSPNSTLSIGTSTPDVTVDLNLGHANTWTATQIFQGPANSNNQIEIYTPSGSTANMAAAVFESGVSGTTAIWYAGLVNAALSGAAQNDFVWNLGGVGNILRAGSGKGLYSFNNTLDDGSGAATFTGHIVSQNTLNADGANFITNYNAAPGASQTGIEYFSLLSQINGTSEFDLYAKYNTNSGSAITANFIALYGYGLASNLLDINLLTGSLASYKNTLDDGSGNSTFAGSVTANSFIDASTMKISPWFNMTTGAFVSLAMSGGDSCFNPFGNFPASPTGTTAFGQGPPVAWMINSFAVYLNSGGAINATVELQIAGSTVATKTTSSAGWNVWTYGSATTAGQQVIIYVKNNSTTQALDVYAASVY